MWDVTDRVFSLENIIFVIIKDSQKANILKMLNSLDVLGCLYPRKCYKN